jgi:hypothetical protein
MNAFGCRPGALGQILSDQMVRKPSDQTDEQGVSPILNRFHAKSLCCEVTEPTNSPSSSPL